MKIIKLLFKLLVVVVVLAIAAVAALPLWFGPVAKTVANSAVPGIVKTDFHLNHIALNPYTARFELGGMNLGNPEGCSVKDAVSVGEIVFDAETLSLMTDVIHIEEIRVRDLFVSVVSDRQGVWNYRQLQKNVMGEREKSGAQAAAKSSPTKAEPVKTTKETAVKSEKPSKKIIIDRLEISGLKLQLSFIPIRVPTIVLTDIGRKSGGASLEEAWQQIVEGVMKAAGVTGDQLKALGALSSDTLKKANQTVSEVTTKARATVDEATQAVSSTTKQATDAVGATTQQAGEMATKGAEAVGEGAKAVGEGAKKALDSLKSLW